MKHAGHNMLEIIKKQLTIDMNCEPADLDKDGIVFCEAGLNAGRRLFDRQTPYLEAATMGKATVVSADRSILPQIRPLLETKTREDVFAAPLLYGHSLYYIPDLMRIERLPCPAGFQCHGRKGTEIHELYQTAEFENAIQYDPNHPRPDVIALCATYGGEIAAVAGASQDCALMWQIGIDVLPKYRSQGLAAYLVSNLALDIMEKGVVPYYGTASSNIASQVVAHRAGLMPAWMCSYHNTLDGSSPYAHDALPPIPSPCPAPAGR